MKCFWIFGHTWGQWEQYGYTYQRRVCLDCGRISSANI